MPMSSPVLFLVSLALSLQLASTSAGSLSGEGNTCLSYPERACEGSLACAFCSGPDYCHSTNGSSCAATCAQIASMPLCAATGQCQVCSALQYCTNSDSSCITSCNEMTNASFCSTARNCQLCSAVGYCESSKVACEASCSGLKSARTCAHATSCRWCYTEEACVAATSLCSSANISAVACVSSMTCKLCPELLYPVGFGDTCKTSCKYLKAHECDRSERCVLCNNRSLTYCMSTGQDGVCQSMCSAFSDRVSCLAAAPACRFCDVTRVCTAASASCPSVNCLALSRGQCVQSAACTYCPVVDVCITQSQCPMSCSVVTSPDICNASSACSFCSALGYCRERRSETECKTNCDEITRRDECGSSKQCRWCTASASCMQQGAAACSAAVCAFLDSTSCVASAYCQYCAATGSCLEAVIRAASPSPVCPDSCGSLSFGKMMCENAPRCKYCPLLMYCTDKQKDCGQSCSDLNPSPRDCSASGQCVPCTLSSVASCIPKDSSATLCHMTRCSHLDLVSCVLSPICQLHSTTQQCMDIGAANDNDDCTSLSSSESSCVAARGCSYCGSVGLCFPVSSFPCSAATPCHDLPQATCMRSRYCHFCYDTLTCRGVNEGCGADCASLPPTMCASSATNCQFCVITASCIAATGNCAASCSALSPGECQISAACQYCSSLGYCTQTTNICQSTCETLALYDCTSAWRLCSVCSDSSSVTCVPVSSGCLPPGGLCTSLSPSQCALSSACQYCSMTGSCSLLNVMCPSSCTDIHEESSCNASPFCHWCTTTSSLGSYCSLLLGSSDSATCLDNCSQIDPSICLYFPTACALSDEGDCVAISNRQLTCSALPAASCGANDTFMNCSYCQTLDVCLPIDEGCPDVCSGLQSMADCDASPNCTFCTELGYCKNRSATSGSCATSCSMLSMTHPGECGGAEYCTLCQDDNVCTNQAASCAVSSCLAQTPARCASSIVCQYCPDVGVCIDVTGLCPSSCFGLNPMWCTASPYCTYCAQLQICIDRWDRLPCPTSCPDLSRLQTTSPSCSASPQCQRCRDGSCQPWSTGTCEPISCLLLTAGNCVQSGVCRYCQELGICVDAATPQCPHHCSDLTTVETCSYASGCTYCALLGYCTFRLVDCYSSCAAVPPSACSSSVTNCSWCAGSMSCVAIGQDCSHSTCVSLSASNCVQSPLLCDYCPSVKLCAPRASCPVSCSDITDPIACGNATSCQLCSDGSCTVSSGSCISSSCSGQSMSACLTSAECKYCPDGTCAAASNGSCIAASSSSSSSCLILESSQCVQSPYCTFCDATGSCIDSGFSCPGQCEDLSRNQQDVCRASSSCTFCTELSYCTAAVRGCSSSCGELLPLECLGSSCYLSNQGICRSNSSNIVLNTCSELSPTACAQYSSTCVFCVSVGMCLAVDVQCPGRCSEIETREQCEAAVMCHYCTHLAYCAAVAMPCASSCQALSQQTTGDPSVCDAAGNCKSCYLGDCRSSTSSCLDDSCLVLSPAVCAESFSCRWYPTVAACLSPASLTSAFLPVQVSCSALDEASCSTAQLCEYCPQLVYCADSSVGCRDSCEALSSDEASCRSATSKCSYCKDFRTCVPLLAPCLPGFPSCSMLSPAQCVVSSPSCQFCSHLGYCSESFNGTVCAIDCKRLDPSQCAQSPSCHYCSTTGYCAGVASVCNKSSCMMLSPSECVDAAECFMCDHIGYCIPRNATCPSSCFELSPSTPDGCVAAASCGICSALGYCGNRSLTCSLSCVELSSNATCAAASSCIFCDSIGYCSSRSAGCVQDCFGVDSEAECTLSTSCHWCPHLGLCNPLTLNCTGTCSDYSSDATTCDKLRNCTFCPGLEYCASKPVGCASSCLLNLTSDLSACASSPLCKVCQGPPSYCAAANESSAACIVGCSGFDVSSCRAVPECLACESLRYCTARENTNGTSSCSVTCPSLLDPVACGKSSVCQYCSALQYCESIDKTCGGQCGDLDSMRCKHSNCTFCTALGYCSHSQSLCKTSCYELVDTLSPEASCINAEHCSFCDSLGYCQAQASAQACDSTCSQITDTAICEHTLRGCHIVGSFCSEGSCFAFVAKGYNAQPYILFVLGIIKDLAVLVFVGFVGDWLKFKAKKVYLKCCGGVTTFDLLYTDDPTMTRPKELLSERKPKRESDDLDDQLDSTVTTQQSRSFAEYSLGVAVTCFPSAEDIMRPRERRKGDETIPVIPPQSILMHHATMHQLIEAGVFYQDQLHVPNVSERFVMINESSSSEEEGVEEGGKEVPQSSSTAHSSSSATSARLQTIHPIAQNLYSVNASGTPTATSFKSTKQEAPETMRPAHHDADDERTPTCFCCESARPPNQPPRENDTLSHVFAYVEHVLARQQLQCYYSISIEPMKRISRSLSLYPGVVALVYYVASALVLLVATTIDVSRIDSATAAQKFQLIGFRIMNSGVNGTISLLFVKYLRHLLCSGLTLEEHAVRNRRQSSGLDFFNKRRSSGLLESTQDRQLSSYHAHSNFSSVAPLSDPTSYFRYNQASGLMTDLDQAKLYGHLATGPRSGGSGSSYSQHPGHPFYGYEEDREGGGHFFAAASSAAKNVLKVFLRGLVMNAEVDCESPMLISDYFRFKTSTVLHFASGVYFLVLAPFAVFGMIGFALYIYIFLAMALITGLVRSLLMVIRAQLNSRSFLAVMLDFFVNESIPTVFLALLLQTSFNYSLLFMNRELYQLDYGSVVTMEYNARTFGCLKSNLQQQLSDAHDDFSHLLQVLSTLLPFF